MKQRVCSSICMVVALILFMPPTTQSSFAQGGGGRRSQEKPQRGTHPQGPEPVFHTDVPERMLDVTLARPTDRSVTVVVTSHEDLDLSVEYGTTPGEYSVTTPTGPGKSGDTTHLVLSSLKPNTRYYYRVRYQIPDTPWVESTPEYTFHTQRPAGEPFCFTIQADSHLDEPTDANVYLESLKHAANAKPDFHIDLGDTFMTDKYGRDYRQAEAQYYAQRYYFGRLCHSAPLFLTLGNHDGEAGWSFAPQNDNISVWSHGMRTSLFPNPTPDSFYTGNSEILVFSARSERPTGADHVAGAVAPRRLAAQPPYSGNSIEMPGLGYLQNYYAWSWGDAHFIVLDPFWSTSTRGRSVDEGWRWTLGREQYDWLRNTLEMSDAAFKFVFIHNLVGGNDEAARGGAEAAAFFEWGGENFDGTYTFNDRRPGFVKPIHNLLVDNGVSVVFHGHDHFFARQERDGVVYQLVPQPGHASKQRRNAKPGGQDANKISGNAHRMAAEYGYRTGNFLSGSGCLRIAVSPSEATVDYLLSDGNASDTTVAYSYTLASGLSGADENTTQDQHGDSPSQWNTSPSMLHSGMVRN